PPRSPALISGSTMPGRVELRVADTGPGIPPSELDKVFLPFQRLGDTDTTTGIGLGLAVSRGLVEAMGGTLEPEETPGGGLTMVLSVPSAPAGGHPGHPGRADPGRRERGEVTAPPAAAAPPPATSPPATAEGGRLAT